MPDLLTWWADMSLVERRQVRSLVTLDALQTTMRWTKPDTHVGRRLAAKAARLRLWLQIEPAAQPPGGALDHRQRRQP